MAKVPRDTQGCNPFLLLLFIYFLYEQSHENLKTLQKGKRKKTKIIHDFITQDNWCYFILYLKSLFQILLYLKILT